jgi:arylformamidase
VRHRIDLFRPDDDDEGRPIVVIIHGGYWRSLDISMFSHWAGGANARGYPVAVVEYRLCPEVTVADIIEDARSAALFLYRRYGRRVVVCGHSAGGHLAAALCATEWRAYGSDVPGGLVRQGLAISGVFDLEPLTATSMNADLHLDLEQAKAVSPAFWPVPAGVVFDALVGGEEASEFLRQSRLIVDRWASAGAQTLYSALPGANHFTAPNALADPGSGMVDAVVKLLQAAAKA